MLRVKDKLIIGFMGLKQSGKTTAAEVLMQSNPYDICLTSFAEPLKRSVKELFLFSNKQLTDPKLKEVVDPRWGKSPRQIMQLFGTDFVREMIKEDFWVQRMLSFIDKTDAKVFVLDDIRFSEEAQICDYIFAIYRDGQINRDGHQSENPPYHMADSVIINRYNTVEEYRKFVATESKAAKLIQEYLY